MSTVASPDVSARLQAAHAEYGKLQSQLQDIVDARQRLGSQLVENEAVQAEFKGLKDDSEVYKLIGPVLVKQDVAEAKSTVDKRLEFIQSEIKRVEGSISEVEGKADAKRNEIGQLQTSVQAAMQAQAKGDS